MRPAETGVRPATALSRVDFPASVRPQHAEDLAGCCGEADREA